MNKVLTIEDKRRIIHTVTRRAIRKSINRGVLMVHCGRVLCYAKDGEIFHGTIRQFANYYLKVFQVGMASGAESFMTCKEIRDAIKADEVESYLQMEWAR